MITNRYMKRAVGAISLLLPSLLLLSIVSCSDKDGNGSANVGLGIKTFFPTKVVTNQPMTINGSFDVMPRMHDGHFVCWHPLSLTIHKPILPLGKGAENIRQTEEQSYKIIMSGLIPERQGYVENPDQ